MILVDTSVWIDHFRDVPSVAVEHLNKIRSTDQVIIGDLILVELLQGCRDDRQAELILGGLEDVDVVELCGHGVAIAAAHNYRRLRTIGFTVRKTIDTVIATFCIQTRCPLLYADRDFDPFVEHLGLRPALYARLS